MMCAKKDKGGGMMDRLTFLAGNRVRIKTNSVEKLARKLTEYEDFEEIFREKMTDTACEFLKDKEEFGKWLDRNKWIAKKCDEWVRAEEQGLLLRLPCKVGSTLYQPISNRINEYKAIGLCFDITRNEFMYEVAYQIGLEWYKTTCDFDCINKTVFLTQAEAEQKLKEMKSD